MCSDRCGKCVVGVLIGSGIVRDGLGVDVICHCGW